MALQDLSFYVALTIIFSATVALRLLLASCKPDDCSYPPGPPSHWPFTGPVVDSAIPQWITYTQWSKQYGELYHFRFYGQHYIVINSEKIANDLLERRSKVYSSKPKTTILDITGWCFNVGIMPYAAGYRPIQLRKLHDMLRHLLASPEDFLLHNRTFAASIVMSTVYGREIEDLNDRFVSLAERTMAKFSDSIFPGTATVDIFPILRYLPEWFPGAGFQREARICREMNREMQDAPFDFVLENLASGTPNTSMVAQLLESNATQGVYEGQERLIKEVAATAFVAGADTTVSALTTFFLAMVLHLEVQKRAQEEIDRVVGGGRLPDYGDRDSLPYVEAIYREVMRWRPALPLSVGRTTVADDVYDGYFIPKGAIILSNIWAMTRNEAKYPIPELFDPERFFAPGNRLNDDNTVLAFGFGCRICVGRHMADATVWATIVSVLAVFNISQAVDELGRKIDVAVDYTHGAVSHARPFQCSITPRSDAARRLILSADTVSGEA